MMDAENHSPQPNEEVYQLAADESLTLQVNDTSVRVEALTQGGCQITLVKEETGRAAHLEASLKLLKSRWQPLWQRLSGPLSLPWQIDLPRILLILSLVLYLSTRLIGLRSYPIYFFSDEAVQTILAEDLVNGDFRDADGIFLPTFFYNGYQYNLGPSVYLQLIPYLLFGRVLEVNRGVSVLATSLAAVFLFLTAKRVFRLKYAWTLVLLLSIAPIWFLHSRTSFETSLAFMFYSGFVAFYLLYREGSPRSLYGAVILAALAFYTYSPLRIVVLASALLFFLVDIRFHLQHRKTLLYAFGLAVLTTLPFIRFEVEHPGQNINHLRILGSYWIQDISIFEKGALYFKEYFLSFSPKYWFLPHTDELSRHRMGPHPFAPVWMLAFVLGGMLLAARRWREPRCRALFFLLLLAPSGAAMVARGSTRILVMLIPLLLFTGLALEWLLDKAQQRYHLSQTVLSLVVFLVLGWSNIYLLNDALVNGPLWDTDYGMSGMQYGAVQLADKIPEFLAEQPASTHLIVTPTWANGTDVVMRFFFGTPLPFAMGNIDTYINQYTPLAENTVLVMTKDEYERMEQSGKFSQVHILDRIPYPNGDTGFLFVNLQYVEDIQEIFAREVAARRVLQVEEMDIGGIPAEVAYSYLDMGSIADAFDQDDDTLLRTMEANPMEIRVTYSRLVTLTACTAHIGGTASTLDLSLLGAEEQVLSRYHLEVKDTPSPRTVDFNILPEQNVHAVRFVLKNTYDAEPAHVHLWEFTCSREAE